MIKNTSKKKKNSYNNYSKYYKDIPAVENEYIEDPIKTFVVDVDMISALCFRILIDGKDEREGIINTLDGPSDREDFKIKIPFPKLHEILLETASDEVKIEVPHQDMYFGLMDIVTYPFFFSLIHNIQLSKTNASEKLWKINSNLVNHYYPSLNKMGGVISVCHFNEEPIDDAPTHNIVLFPFKEKIIGEKNLQLLLNEGVNPKYVTNKNSVMDDRYILSQRKPEDGEPFDLNIIKQYISV